MKEKLTEEEMLGIKEAIVDVQNGRTYSGKQVKEMLYGETKE